MNLFEMFKALINQEQINVKDDDVTVDKIIVSDDIDNTFIAAFGGFK